MSTLYIQMFGGLRLAWGPDARHLAIAPSAQPLLSYLLLFHRRSHPRDRLGELFWPHLAPDKARHCLNTALWRIRKQLEPREEDAGRYLLSNGHNGVQFNSQSDHWLDVTVFEEALSMLLSTPIDAVSRDQVVQVEQALALYTGELLEEIDADWLIPERERFRLLRMHACSRLMEWYRRHGELDRSIQYGHSLLDEDPLQEGIHQELIRLYLARGQRASAFQQYERCRRILLAELDVEPLAETEALLSRPHPDIPGPDGSLDTVPQQMPQILERLRLAWAAYQRAHLELERALQALFDLQNSVAHTGRSRKAP